MDIRTRSDRHGTSTDAGAHRRRGFSLIELLIVIAVVAMLAGMLSMSVKLVRESSRSAVCQSNLRHIGAGLIAYTQDWRGIFPYSYITSPFAPRDVYLADYGCWAEEKVVGSYLESKAINCAQWWPSQVPRGVLHCPSSEFLYKNSPGQKLLQYGLNTTICPDVPITGWGTLANSPTRLVKLREASNLALATDSSESRWNPGGGGSPSVIPNMGYSDPRRPVDWAQSPYNRPFYWVRRHPYNKGANVLFCDGHVRRSTDIGAEALARTLYACVSTLP